MGSVGQDHFFLLPHHLLTLKSDWHHAFSDIGELVRTDLYISEWGYKDLDNHCHDIDIEYECLCYDPNWISSMVSNQSLPSIYAIDLVKGPSSLNPLPNQWILRRGSSSRED